MKLRNWSLTAAVVFFVGIAFAVAEEPADEDTFRETTYTYDTSLVPDLEGSSDFPLSFYKTAGNGADDATLFEQIGIAGSGRSDESAASATSRTSGEDMSLRVFDLSSSFSGSVTEEIGFTARSDRGNPLVFSEVIAESPNKSQSAGNETYSLLTFDKKAFTNARNWGQIISGGSNFNDGEEEGFLVFFSSIVTIPFAILSFSICIGFLLIMFTTSGKKSNV